MAMIDSVAEAALARDALRLRAATIELLRCYSRICDVPPPESRDPSVQATAAGLIELFAERQFQPPPSWSADFGALDAPFHLLASAARMPRLRAECEAESPPPLRKRKLYAPSNFLTFV